MYCVNVIDEFEFFKTFLGATHFELRQPPAAPQLSVSRGQSRFLAGKICVSQRIISKVRSKLSG